MILVKAFTVIVELPVVEAVVVQPASVKEEMV